MKLRPPRKLRGVSTSITAGRRPCPAADSPAPAGCAGRRWLPCARAAPEPGSAGGRKDSGPAAGGRPGAVQIARHGPAMVAGPLIAGDHVGAGPRGGGADSRGGGMPAAGADHRPQIVGIVADQFAGLRRQARPSDPYISVALNVSPRFCVTRRCSRRSDNCRR